MALPTDAKIDFLLCDVARQDASGKLDLAGYFPTTEVKLDPAVQLPAAVNLTFVFILKDGDGQFRATFRILDPLGKEMHRQDIAEVRKPVDQPHILMIGVQLIPIVHSGNYAVVLEINGQPYRRTVRIFQ